MLQVFIDWFVSNKTDGALSRYWILGKMNRRKKKSFQSRLRNDRNVHLESRILYLNYIIMAAAVQSEKNEEKEKSQKEEWKKNEALVECTSIKEWEWYSFEVMRLLLRVRAW